LAAGQFGLTIPFSKQRPASVSTFAKHIPHVVSLGAQKEVRWIDANPVVTFMKNAKTVEYRAAKELVRKTMGKMFIVPSVVKHSVALCVNNTTPHPASVINHRVLEKVAFRGARFCTKSVCPKFSSAHPTKPIYNVRSLRKLAWHVATLLCMTLVTCGIAGAQTGTPTKQSGNITPNHGVMWIGNGIIGDAGTAANGLFSSLGTTGLGPTICANSGPATGGPYNQLCLTATSTGAGFSLNNYNGATGGFTLTLNGVAQGLVTISLPSILNNPVCFANTTGTLQNCSVTGSGSAVLQTSPSIANLTVTGSFTATGLVTNADLANSTMNLNGTTCTLGPTLCTVTTASASVTIGTTTVAGGTSGTILYQNGASPAGTLGEMTTTGSGLVVVLATSPSIASLTVTSAFTATGLVTLADMATQAANTVLVNATGGVASPTAQAVSSCSAANNALIWTTNSGFGCNTSITAAVMPAGGLTGQVAVANGGTGLATLTSGAIYKGNTTSAIATSALSDNGTIVTSSESIDAQTNAFIIEVPNSGSGTTINLIAKLSSGQAITTLTSDTNTAIGIVIGGAGTTGNAQIAQSGQASCVFDGGTTSGDYVSISITVAGNCHDAGATYPTSGQILGRVLSTNGGGGTYAMLVFPSEIDGATGGGGGFTSAQISAGTAISISGTCNSSASISCTVSNTGVTGVNSLSGAVTVASNGGSSVATSGSSVILGEPGGYVNKFRNGTFSVWQRGTASQTIGSTGNYSADGWKVYFTGSANVAAVRASGPTITLGNAGALYALRVTGAASNTDIKVGQRIESYDAAPVAGQTVTVQFQFYQNTGGSIAPKISSCYASATDNFGTCTADLAATNITSCATATWCTEAYTFTVSSNAVNGYEIDFDCNGAYTSAPVYCQITDADVRVTPGGTVGVNANPPPPELRSVQAELAQSQRYFISTFGNGNAVPTSTINGLVMVDIEISGTLAATMNVVFPTQMRAAPSISYWDAASNASKLCLMGSTGTTCTNNTSNSGSGAFGIGVAGFGFSGYAASTTGTFFIHYTASAEL